MEYLKGFRVSGCKGSQYKSCIMDTMRSTAPVAANHHTCKAYEEYDACFAAHSNANVDSLLMTKLHRTPASSSEQLGPYV